MVLKYMIVIGLMKEFQLRGIAAEKQVRLPIEYEE
jgi:hypothetical protein